MKTATSYTALACIVTLTLLFFASCRHKELCYGHPHGQTVRLVFDWRYINDVPGAMRVFFYPVNNSRRTEPYVFDVSALTRAEGSEIFLEEGTYQVVSFNIDTEYILYRKENSHSEFEAYTQGRTLTLNSSQGGKTSTKTLSLVGTPDWMCRASLDEVHIGSVQGESPKQIVLTPRSAVSKFTCEVRGIKNPGRVKGVIGTLSGVAGSLFMGTGTFPAAPSTVYFDGEMEGGVVRGNFLVFGLHPQAVKPEDKVLTLYFRTDAGISAFSFNVGDRIEIEEDDGHYVIKANVVIEGDIELPSPIVSDEDGLVVDAEEWDAVYIDIDINI
ncbi:uncharacterized protein DUF5119 [Bacteroides zoogleoformans]|uniref:DUF5119 domain-containing protein n=1 Tax=Bacteroides zoogleoformans TaxID=28119 RepID=A0ABM6T8E3_9BACE|nr:DUF5119 domain-containing protein [Bacteroides zoogleoformans]AVM52963.1 hypothetical protein C4H11_08440 [Bacteroides zoogleoformans]TWJ18496.1 uncharacterized protein DUF5119 [Bacteroides zoogleoformans]